MASRNVYTALTPEGPHFDLQSPRSLSTCFPPDTEPISFPKSDPWWRRAVERTADVVRSNTGLLLVMVAQAFASAHNTSVKKLDSIDPPVPTLELVLIRMSITWVCCIVYMTIAKVPDPLLGPKGVRLLLALRGFAGFFGLFGGYYSLQYLSLSDATVLQFLSPISTGIAGALVLKEAFSRKEALAGICSLCGVILIARPPFLFGKAAEQVTSPVDGIAPADTAETATTAQRLGAVGTALLGVMGATIAFTSLRAIGKRAHPMHSLSSFSSQCVIAAAAGIIIFRIPLVAPTRLDWAFLLVMIGLFAFTAQILTTMGLQRETAGRATMGIYVQIVFATILERIFFHPKVSLLSLFGTAIIMSSAIYVALTKTKDNAKKSKETHLADSDNIALEEGLMDGQESDGVDDIKDDPSHSNDSIKL